MDGGGEERRRPRAARAVRSDAPRVRGRGRPTFFGARARLERVRCGDGRADGARHGARVRRVHRARRARVRRRGGARPSARRAAGDPPHGGARVRRCERQALRRARADRRGREDRERRRPDIRKERRARDVRERAGRAEVEAGRGVHGGPRSRAAQVRRALDAPRVGSGGGHADGPSGGRARERRRASRGLGVRVPWGRVGPSARAAGQERRQLGLRGAADAPQHPRGRDARGAPRPLWRFRPGVARACAAATPGPRRDRAARKKGRCGGGTRRTGRPAASRAGKSADSHRPHRRDRDRRARYAARA